MIGLENVKAQSGGKISVESDALVFVSRKSQAKIAVSAIDDILLGSETTQAGGKTGKVFKAAAIAAPYETGRFLSVLMWTKVDILTVLYRDENGGVHSAVFALPEGQAGGIRTQLIAAGARAAAPSLALAAVQTTDQTSPMNPSGTRIQIEPPEAGSVSIPAEFLFTGYERLIERVRQDGEFQKVFRSGDRQAHEIADLVILRTKVSGFKPGNQLLRELLNLVGWTSMDVTTTIEGRDGRVILSQSLSGKVHFFGENLGVTNDLAKHIAKLLREHFQPVGTVARAD
ncbi:MAG: hypothetical protein ABSH31_13605 [Bryobacteraceae bacterium]